ncbi:hypothetical protein ACOMHN_020007 [Nucella lapillus]
MKQQDTHCGTCITEVTDETAGHTLWHVHHRGAVGLQRQGGERPVPMDENPITITVTQGSTAVLPCSVDPRYTEQNKDQYKVVWVSPERTAISIEDRRMINDMRISVERPFLRDWNLHIRNVSITDTGEFMCQLNTDPVKSKSVHLLVNVPPSIVEYTQPVELTRMEGQEIELYCNATGVPRPTVTWFRMNRWTTAKRDRELVCVDGGGGGGGSIELYCNATGVPRSTDTWFRMNRWTTAKRDQLYCNATGGPRPTVTWFRMNRWTTAKRDLVGSDGEQLVIYNVTRMCADVYLCVADNSVPPATSQEFIVGVNCECRPGPEPMKANQLLRQCCSLLLSSLMALLGPVRPGKDVRAVDGGIQQPSGCGRWYTANSGLWTVVYSKHRAVDGGIQQPSGCGRWYTANSGLWTVVYSNHRAVDGGIQQPSGCGRWYTATTGLWTVVYSNHRAVDGGIQQPSGCGRWYTANSGLWTVVSINHRAVDGGIQHSNHRAVDGGIQQPSGCGRWYTANSGLWTVV